MTYYQCSMCDVEAESIDDNIFVDCKPNNHEILMMSGETTLQRTSREEIEKMPTDQFQEKLQQEFTRLKEVIEHDFPNRSFAIEVGLSVKAQLKIEGITQVFAPSHMNE